MQFVNVSLFDLNIVSFGYQNMLENLAVYFTILQPNDNGMP